MRLSALALWVAIKRKQAKKNWKKKKVLAKFGGKGKKNATVTLFVVHLGFVLTLGSFLTFWPFLTFLILFDLFLLLKLHKLQILVQTL